MVERDVFERRDYAPTVPDDPLDPPQFGQPLETVKDAMVLELRTFFNQPRLNVLEVERRREIPTVRKYAVGFGPDTDPYETVQQIVQDFADIGEKLPHVAVTAVQGTNNRLTAGQPFIGHVQRPPRLDTGVEPFALGGSAAESWRVLVTAATPGVQLDVVLFGQSFPYVVQASDTTQDAARGLYDALRPAVEFFAISRAGSALTIALREVNTPFTPLVSADLTAAQLQAAGTAGTDQLVFRTTPERTPDVVVEETITFDPLRFPTANPASAARAVDVARVFNEQAKNARAVVFDTGAGSQVRFQTGGKLGGARTPNEIEVLETTTDNLLAIFGFGARGTGGAGSTIAGSPPDTSMTLTTTGIGTAAAAAVQAGVVAYVVLDNVGSNNGRFRVLSVVGPDAITYDNQDGVAASFTGGTWFVGHRDDWKNLARPMMNRRHESFKLTVSLSVLAESPTEREELQDLVLTQFAYYLEQKYFTLLGRGVFDERFPDEHYQISIAQEVAPAGQATVARAGPDPKNSIYEARISVPVTLFMYQDRAVLVPSGPRAGESFVVVAADVSQR